MTVLGKILTFFVLILAVAQLALHVMFHVTQTNWNKAYVQLRAKYDVDTADLAQYAKDARDARNERDEEVKKGQDEKAKLETQLADLKAQVEQKDKQVGVAQDQVVRAGAAQGATVIDVARHQQEVGELQKQLDDANQRNKELVDNANKSRDRAVAAEIESRSLKERNANLTTQLEEMSKDLVKAKNGGGAGAAGGTLTARNPPPEDVEGFVTKADSSGMVTISRGSDDGLTKGNTLEVFRLSPAKYLGTIRIIQVTPHEAVGQFVSRPLGQVQAGDKVASKILGGG